MPLLSPATKRLLARALSPRAAAAISSAIDEVTGQDDQLIPTATHTTNQVAAYGQLVVCDATAASLTVTAPDPVGNAGKRWGMKLVATASAHTLTAVAHAAETFDGGAAPSIAAAGGLYVFTSDGTNWIVTGKI